MSCGDGMETQTYVSIFTMAWETYYYFFSLWPINMTQMCLTGHLCDFVTEMTLDMSLLEAQFN